MTTAQQQPTEESPPYAEQAGASRPHLSLARLLPRTYRQDAAAQLRSAILAGDLPAGAPLVERRLAEEMGVSRAPIREALRKLEEEGLVVTIPYKGSYVTRVSPETMDEILSLRLVLEGFAAERALGTLREEGMARLKVCLAEMREAASSAREDSLVTSHLAFHRALYEAAHHQLLWQFWQMMESQLRLYGAVHQRLYESLDDYASAHAALISVLETESVQSVRAVVVQHILENTAHLVPGHGHPPRATD